MAKQTRKKPEDHFLTISAFIEAKGPARAGEIAGLLGMSSGGAATVLKKLVEKGYLVRDANGQGSHPSYDVRRGEPVVMKQKAGGSSDQERRIAEAAVLLFGDIRATDLLAWLRWVNATKEMMD